MRMYFARGGGGGGHASASHSSAGRSSSTSSTRNSGTSKSSTRSTTSKPAAGKSTAKPGSTVKVNGKSVKSSAAKPTNSHYSRSTGVVGDNGYTPRFYGYSAPPASVVYYPQHSAMDYLPWIYLFSQSSPSHDQAMIVQPDGKQVAAEPQRGVDGMAIFNWIFLIMIGLAIIGGIVWAVNKTTE